MELKEKLAASFLAFENRVSTDIDSAVHDIRSEAFTHFERHGFPTKRDEEWKFMGTPLRNHEKPCDDATLKAMSRSLCLTISNEKRSFNSIH